MTRLHRLVGLLVALSLAAAGCTNPLGQGHKLTVEFPSTFNLFAGSAVRVAGVDVGQVKDIEVPQGSDVVRVTLTVASDVRLPADVRAVIVPQALLGERYVQLDPPYREGEPEFDFAEPIPVERTGVPADFDEVLDSLNDYLEALPEDEVARLVTNLASVLDGQGENLGSTLDNAAVAIDVLRENDDELVSLASRLSELNEALNSRNEELGDFIEDANTVVSSLADDRAEITAALDGVARMTRELADLLVDHRETLEEDLGTVTRIGRTAVRNLDQIDRYLFWSAELYRHAGRVIDRDENWLPLTNNFPGLSTLIADRVADRLTRLCEITGVDCTPIADELPDQICFDPVLPCENTADPAATVPLADALTAALEAQPDLAEALEQRGQDLQDAIAGDPGSLLPPSGDEDTDDGPSEEPSDGSLLPPLARRGVLP